MTLAGRVNDMADEKTPFHNPFAALGKLRDTLPAGPAAGPEPAKPAAPEAPTRPARVIRRAVVRLERTRRGGKEVTVVDHMDLDAAECAAWLKALKAALGCGGTVEGRALVFQGDQRERLPRLLTSRGVKKITIA
jgi:translation initiation factor 1